MNALKRVVPGADFLKQVGFAGIMAGTSSLVTQKLVEKQQDINISRVLSFMLVTVGLVAPIQYHWFRFLNNRIPGQNLSTGLKRMIVDQAVAAPLVTSLFLFNLQLLETGSVKASLNRTQSILEPVMRNNYKVWPAVQTLNMSLVPLEYRVVFLQFIGIFWNCYLSYVSK